MYLNDKLPTADVKADVFALESLIAWLRTKPADEVYCYIDRGRCLAAQFNEFCGTEYVTPTKMLGPSYRPGEPFNATLERIAVQVPNTFGAALLRAEKLLSGK